MKRVYGDTKEEYHALRGGSGLLTYDEAGLIAVSGQGAARFVGTVCTRSADFLLEGQSSPALLLSDGGTVLAEALIHCRGRDYLIEISASAAKPGVEHLLAAAADYPDVSVEDMSDALALLAVEGPGSFRIADKYLDMAISAMAYSSIASTDWNGTEMWVSRTGVTGEYGYKFYVPTESAETLSKELAEAGAVPVGADALDICRMEMRFVNLDRECGDDDLTPFDMGLQWMVDFAHDFTGKDAVERARNATRQTAPVCWMSEPGAVLTDDGKALEVEGTQIGRVVSAMYSPGLERTIGVARVSTEVAGSGLVYEVSGTGEKVSTVSAPFLVATSFGVPME